MEGQLDQNRWQQLFYMMVAMATGNFSCQIPRTKNDDEMEALVALCNMLAQELKEIFSQYGFLNPKKSFLYLAQMSFHLDEQFKIVGTSQDTLQLLNYLPNELKGTPFKELLEKDFREEWEKMETDIAHPLSTRFSLKLNIPTRHGLHISTFCFVSKIIDGTKTAYTVTSFQPVLYKDYILTAQRGVGTKKQQGRTIFPGIFERKPDLQTVHRVRDYILQNLDTSLPLAEDLAHTFATNESKLKEDFRQVFGLTPFQFYNKERIQYARELIENTDLPLKTIAGMAGYNAYPHFSYAYKKEFGYSPKIARKFD